jgi:pimeloyl-ACP methyl ester carboxylesterase
MLRWFEHRQVYEPSGAMAGSAAEVGRAFTEVSFEAGDGCPLHGWFFPADPSSFRRHLTLLLLHGNTGNVSHRLPFYRAWLELGLNVFAFDYRGFGRSAGKPSELGTYLDAQAACRWLREQQFAPEQILALGESLGGGVGSELALREPLGGLVLQNTFTNIPDIGSERFPWLPVRRLHSIHYNTLAKLPRIKVPVLVMHSRGDLYIGFHHAERNFAAANEPKMFWEIYGTHMGMLDADRKRYLEGLDRFLSTHLPQNGKRSA